MLSCYINQQDPSQRIALFTGGFGWGATVLGGAAAAAWRVLILRSSHHEVWQGAWDAVGKVWGGFGFRRQGVLLEETERDEEEGTPEGGYLKQ